MPTTAPSNPLASADAAVATAAHDAMVGVVTVGALPFAGFGSPTQQAAAVAFLDAALAADMATRSSDGMDKTRGIAVGHNAALSNPRRGARATGRRSSCRTRRGPILASGSRRPARSRPVLRPPPTASRPSCRAGEVSRRSRCAPANRFGADGPANLASDGYARDYNEVKAIGEKLSTLRTTSRINRAILVPRGSPAG